MPRFALCFALGSGFGSSRFHSFFVGWCSHDDPSVVVVRAGEALPMLRQLARLSYQIAFMRSSTKRSPRCYLLFGSVVCSRRCVGAPFAPGGPLDGPHPQKSLRLVRAEVLRKLCRNSIGMASFPVKHKRCSSISCCFGSRVGPKHQFVKPTCGPIDLTSVTTGCGGLRKCEALL